MSATLTLFKVCSPMTLHEKDRTPLEKSAQSVCYFNFVRGVLLHVMHCMKRTGLILRNQLRVSATSTLFEVCSLVIFHENDMTCPEKPVKSICTSTLFEVCSIMSLHEKDRICPEKPVQSVC